MKQIGLQQCISDGYSRSPFQEKFVCLLLLHSLIYLIYARAVRMNTYCNRCAVLPVAIPIQLSTALRRVFIIVVLPIDYIILFQYSFTVLKCNLRCCFLECYVFNLVQIMEKRFWNNVWCLLVIIIKVSLPWTVYV